MPEAPVLTESTDTIMQIRLNRPDNRNSMNGEMMPAFREAVQAAQSRPQLRCLIITGSGKSFCAGADFRSALPDADQPLPSEALMALYQPFLALQEIQIPIIGALNGHAIGGGLGLALMCDLRIANRTSKYGANFARLGLHSGMAISYLLPRLVGLPLAAELLFTGRLIDGEEMRRIGLANAAEDEARVLPKAWELAEEIAAGAPLAIRLMKRSLYRGLDWNPTAAAEWEAHCQSRTFETEDAKEGIAALLEKRSPKFKAR